MNTPPVNRRHFTAESDTKHINKHDDESSIFGWYLAFLNIVSNRKFDIAVGGSGPLCKLKIKDVTNENIYFISSFKTFKHSSYLHFHKTSLSSFSEFGFKFVTIQRYHSVVEVNASSTAINAKFPTVYCFWRN